MTDINPELIAKAADAIDGRRHEYRVDADTWRTYCTCGWSAEEPYDVAAHNSHVAVAVLEAVADDLRAEGAAQALEDAADRLDLTELERNSELSRWDYDSSDFYEELVAEWLTAQARAAELRGADQ